MITLFFTKIRCTCAPRRPFVPAALSLLETSRHERAAAWIEDAWSTAWRQKKTALHTYCPTPPASSLGRYLPRLAWTRLNRLRTEVGRFKASLHKWGLSSSAACDCGAELQTADHIIHSCPLYRPPNGMEGLLLLDEATTEWLVSGCPDI